MHGDLLRWRLSRVLRHARNTPGGLSHRYGAATAGPITPTDGAGTASSFFTDLVAGYHRHHAAETSPGGDRDLAGDVVIGTDDIKPSCRLVSRRLWDVIRTLFRLDPRCYGLSLPSG